MLRRTVFIGLALAAASPLAILSLRSEASSPAIAVAAPAGPSWKVDYANSRLGFVGEQTGKAFQGKFRKFEATIVFDPDNPATARIDVTVDMTSAVTGDKQRDSALPGSDWFKAKEFPVARYVARSVEKKPDGSYVAEGDLTIRGVTRRVPLPFTLTLDGKKATAKGEASLIRSDFGVGQGEFADATWVGLGVKVTIDLRATR
ncbi:MAG: YceI family protein [Parvularculaceae bacterium]|jgi:polyisoprenoid-binding protein YceI|nr:YceI family protein [Parvularculaceae bacterium]